MTNLTENFPLSVARVASALNYLDSLDSIEGWLQPTTALAMIQALWTQERLGAFGDIAEIGVWKGKSFLALAAGARPGERLVAIDPFEAGDPLAERPDLDVANYGAGYKAAFLKNLAQFFPAAQPEIIEASSAALANNQSALGKLRLLSIDGGHSRSQTVNDLRLADACLTEEGVCWLDDVFNPHWPGVVSGLFAYLDSGPRLQPVALFPNKLVLVRPGMCETWRTQFRALFARAISREAVELHHSCIDIYDEVWSQIAPALRNTSSRSAAEQRAVAAEAALSTRLDERARTELEGLKSLRTELNDQAPKENEELNQQVEQLKCELAETHRGFDTAMETTSQWRDVEITRRLATLRRSDFNGRLPAKLAHWRWLPGGRSKKRKKLAKDYQLIAESPLFDSQWYQERYPDVARKAEDPILHYLLYGAREGRAPGALFDGARYLEANPDIGSGVNPLIHFIRHGCRENRRVNSAAHEPISEKNRAHLLAVASEPPPSLSPLNELRVPLPFAKALYLKRCELAVFRVRTEGPVCFPACDHPYFSLIISAYNNFRYTIRILELLKQAVHYTKALSGIGIEIVIVDNGSSDETARLEDFVKGIVLRRVSSNIGFTRAANLGASLANGEYLVFINNDMEFESDVFVQLHDVVERDKTEVACFGAAILQFDGTFQDLGSGLWRDGIAQGYFRNEPPTRYAYAYPRDVDYVAGCFFCIAAAEFRQFAGFDEIFSPGYYEETDLSLRLAQYKRKSRVYPEIRVYHLEYGVFSAEIPQSSVELMARNRPIFARRHKDILDTRPELRQTNAYPVRLHSNRLRVLFIEDRVPAQQLGTGYGRTELIVRALLKRADVDILTCFRREDDILPEGFNYIDILHGPERLEQRLTSQHYDAVYICRPHNIAALEQTLNQWRRGGGSVVYDTEAIFSVREIARSEQCESYKAIASTAQFAELIESELSPAGIADAIIAVNESEAAILRRYFDRPVLTIGHYLPTRPIEQELSMRSGLLFVGALTDVNSPNYDSLLWFLDRVWPQIRAKRPQETLLIVGHTRSGVPLDALRREGVITLGFVDDLAKVYATARVFIAPTRFAAGVPFKVHEALSYGLPVVGSRLIAEQLLADDETSPGLMPATVVDNGQEFAESCLTLLTDDRLWHEKRRVALKYMRSVCAPFRLDDAVRELLSQIRPRPINPLTKSYAEWIRNYDTLGADSRQAILKRISMLAYRPLISIVVPLFNTPEPWLRRCIESVREQLYQNWQLCLVDDGSTLLHVTSICQDFAALDSRIRFVRRNENGHIAVATNAALKIAEGEFVAFLDHDDELAVHALYMVAEALKENPALDLIFSDEDKINEQGTRYDPWFKSDWNYDLMLSQNVVVHLAVYRRRILEDIGGCREGFDGSQDYDLTLRFIEHTSPDRIRHLPYVLYHWRAIPGSVALAPNQKEYAYDAAARAVQDHLNRTGTGAVVEREQHPGYYRIHWPLPAILPKVTIIIPTKDRVDLLMESVQSILNKTHYPNFDILIVNNQSLMPQTKDYLRELAQNPKIRVLDYDQPYRYAALNNWAVQQLDTPLLAFVNNDIEVVSPNWLSEMVSHAVRRNVGAVGAKLYYPNGTIQHAGIVAGIGGLAGHPHQGLQRGHPGYFGRAVVAQQFSAVTAACMVMRRNVFLELDGFNDKAFAIAFNDVDLGLRLNRAGYSVVWTPYAELIHHESASLGPPDSPERKTQFERECRMLRLRWTGAAYTDPFYNPNLTIERGDFSLAFPPRLLRPWDNKVQ